MMLGALLLLVPAHDHWLDVVNTTTVGWMVHHRVGEGLVTELERPWEPDKTQRAELRGLTKTVDLLTRKKEKKQKKYGPLVLGKKIEPGLLIIDRKAVDITLEGPKFLAYLREEGIDRALNRQGLVVDSTRPNKERYRRYLKAIVGPYAPHAAIGQRLEIVPISPLGSGAARVDVTLLFDGMPLAGATMFAEHRDGARLDREGLTTAEDGTTTFSLSHPGRWLIRTVHMRKCATDCGPAEWESHWAALTFDVPATEKR